MQEILRTLQTAVSAPLLMLDYDGTLAPFVADRSQAFPYPGVVPLLEKIRAETLVRVVIVSGRAVEDVVTLLGMSPPPEVWGCHGWERRLPTGEKVTGKLPMQARQGLQQARQLAEARGWHDQLEIKPVSVALHWRGLENAAREALRREVPKLWRPLAKDSALELHDFDGGVELRLRHRSKADAVHTLRQECAEETLLVYLGDDFTDEDAFKALPEQGVGVLVREQYRPTAANYWLKPPDALLRLLREVHATFACSEVPSSEEGEFS